MGGGGSNNRSVTLGAGAGNGRERPDVRWWHWMQINEFPSASGRATRSPRQYEQTIREDARSRLPSALRRACGKSLLLVWRAIVLAVRAALSSAYEVSCRVRAERSPVLRRKDSPLGALGPPSPEESRGSAVITGLIEAPIRKDVNKTAPIVVILRNDGSGWGSNAADVHTHSPPDNASLPGEDESCDSLATCYSCP